MKTKTTLRLSDGTFKQVEGEDFTVKLAGQSVRFFVDDESETLTHVDSGMGIGGLRAIKVANFKSYSRMTNAGAAEILINKLIAARGIIQVMARLDNAPKLEANNEHQSTGTAP